MEVPGYETPTFTPRVLPTLKPSIPIIKIQDCDDEPFLTLKYIHGTTELVVGDISQQIKKLPSHQGRGYIKMTMDDKMLEVVECTPAYLENFWQCVGYLLDYYTTFMLTDDPNMKALWNRFFDIVQASGRLPHNYFNRFHPCCSHAEEFAFVWVQTLELINQLLEGREGREAEDIVHHTGYGITARRLGYPGAWKAGLKPWQQYLCDESPGFQVKQSDCVFYGNNDVHREIGRKIEVKNKISQQMLPHGALAIVQRHTERTRELGMALARRAQGLPALDPFRSYGRFQGHAINLAQPQTYTGLTGHPKTFQPVSARTSKGLFLTPLKPLPKSTPYMLPRPPPFPPRLFPIQARKRDSKPKPIPKYTLPTPPPFPPPTFPILTTARQDATLSRHAQLSAPPLGYYIQLGSRDGFPGRFVLVNGRGRRNLCGYETPCSSDW
ncbi:hypothetical protein B0J11DRAFT_289058 [Dendryphion nanum]|uniref:Uncharacterized protein n=1 Tax=Dendryphion nanum TaxID=256645 RepID=A0A9P9IPU5_9PLEO|nr:hypothetical protein B0J11DRAFT_289058 [Dendryphion nanum]